MTEPLNSGNISTRIQRIAELAREHPERSFRSIHHAIDIQWLREAYRRTRKDGAVGVDTQTAADYAADLEGNLVRLLDRFKTGTYRAPNLRRAHIPKGGGETRPIGIPTFEDEVLQTAVRMVLEALYEQDFMDCSWGFRPGRSAHGALDVLWKSVMSMRGAWVVEVDIESFFDTLDHTHLRDFLDHRVTDGVLRRVIHKWLKAGVLEGGRILRPTGGTPQGGVISPLLANIYLHEVLDVWFAREVQPRLRGRAELIRYADDFVVVCEREDDARRVLDVLPKRFGRFGLRLHPDKTRLVRFERPVDDAGDRPETFDFLGFTHYWGTSRRGKPVVKRKTARSRLRRSLRRVWLWCRAHRHDPLREQQSALAAKLRGHFGYFGITGNARALECFRKGVLRAWRTWLDHRGGRRRMTWERFWRLLDHYPLPRARVARSIYRPNANASA
ncbi:MAG TPA: group II intron reverse transcriptase/maturase [Sandaracinaceae bacterium LLY-WYZ-13_1]|nr:group II intron reverse transcriptase/maturase [Sandaracinaceae bacterium LLY-WYZ-13_1]